MRRILYSSRQNIVCARRSWRDTKGRRASNCLSCFNDFEVLYDDGTKIGFCCCDFCMLNTFSSMSSLSSWGLQNISGNARTRADRVAKSTSFSLKSIALKRNENVAEIVEENERKTSDHYFNFFFSSHFIFTLFLHRASFFSALTTTQHCEPESS